MAKRKLRRVDIKKILADPKLRKRLLDRAVKFIIKITQGRGSDEARPE